jgi:hypothetical protein
MNQQFLSICLALSVATVSTRAAEVSTKRVANLVTQERGDSNADRHDPNALFVWMRRGDESGRKNQ